MDAGNLVPDRVVIDMISKIIDNSMDVKDLFLMDFQEQQHKLRRWINCLMRSVFPSKSCSH